jgi:2-polyprenyl-3-methyl-5-hydroxy-6-metoxy-1,4-benzoquinol methylase
MFIKFGNLKQSEYHGIQEMAAYSLHPDIFEMMKPFLEKNMKVLDFGSGQGAFSQRLFDAGMTVDACDLDTDQIRADVRRKLHLDLNIEIDMSLFPEKYDLLTAIEIIEHLHDPWKYLSDCRSLLKDDGILVLSTPNISNFVSRLRMLMRGSLWAFEVPDLKHGHITPLSFIQIENLCKSLNFEILKKGYAGPVPIFHFFNFSRFSILRNTLLPLMYPFMSGPKKGRSLVYILRKK